MSEPTKHKILIVEDEEAILQGLMDVFVFHGFEVSTAKDGKAGLEQALTGNFDMVLLDVMLPHTDGFTICDQIKKQKREQPVIMLTAKTSEDDVVTGLSLGADDYISKPFSVRELVLRVQAVLRRSKKNLSKERDFRLGDDIVIDTVNLVGKVKGMDTLFTRKEIEILQYLSANSDRPVTREELLTEVWGYAAAAHIETRTVDIHMAKLRKKIEPDNKEPVYLITVRGEGYRLNINAK